MYVISGMVRRLQQRWLPQDYASADDTTAWWWYIDTFFQQPEPQYTGSYSSSNSPRHSRIWGSILWEWPIRKIFYDFPFHSVQLYRRVTKKASQVRKSCSTKDAGILGDGISRSRLWGRGWFYFFVAWKWIVHKTGTKPHHYHHHHQRTAFRFQTTVTLALIRC